MYAVFSAKLQPTTGAAEAGVSFIPDAKQPP